MDAPDEVAEAAQLGRRVHRTRHHVRSVEVAAERRRVDGGREAADRLGCQRALVEQRDAALGGAVAERAERAGGALDVGRRRAARRGRRTGSAARRFRARPAQSSARSTSATAAAATAGRCRRRRRGRECSPSTRLGTARPVSACARRSASSRSPSARLRITSTPANPSRFARRKSCASSALGSTSVITPGSRVTAPPVRRRGRPSGTRPASARATAGCGGPSCTARGPRRSRESSSPIAPARPSGYQAPSSSNGDDLAVAVELEEVRAEQDAAADRALGAVDPERRAAARRCARRRPCG